MNGWPDKNSIREAQFAGQFYSDDTVKLKKELHDFFVDIDFEGKNESENKLLRAIISPHAGYIYSGKVAAASFNQISENISYRRIFILASSHRFSFEGAAVYCSGNYKTPLGEIALDNKLAKTLVKNSTLFMDYPEAHLNEHSIEVQLPFLQYRLKHKTKIIPIVLGTQNPDTCRKIANELKSCFSKENLFIISTDFSHYPNYEEANRVDEITANAICKNSPEKLLFALKENNLLKINNLATSLCGWTSVLTLLYLTENQSLEYKKLKYLNSGDTGFYSNKRRVVGYWAMAVYEKESPFQVTEEEKKELLQKARVSVETYVQTGKRGAIINSESNGILNEKTGVFVSIYINDELRGCIGGFPQEKTLNELVQKMAVSSACDKRFDPIGKKDLENMELEISVLSPLKKINSIDEIELGKHGIYIKKNFSSGTFLPQVATKTGWDLEEFLGHCSRDKAGIGWEGWKTAEIFTYEAVIFRGIG